jgi:hypothetical protein
MALQPDDRRLKSAQAFRRAIFRHHHSLALVGSFNAWLSHAPEQLRTCMTGQIFARSRETGSATVRCDGKRMPEQDGSQGTTQAKV